MKPQPRRAASPSKANSSELVRYDVMCRAITAAYKVDEVKTIRDKAVAIAVYARQAKNRDAEILARKIRVRAERKAGQILREMAKHKGGNPRLSNRSKTTTGWDEPATLTKLGISKDQSAEWQKLAAIPDDAFEKALAEQDQYVPSGRKIVRWGLRNDEDQRALKAAKLIDEPSANLQKVSQAQAAKLMNVSPRLVANARKVLKDADPSIIESVERGEQSVSNAAGWANVPKTRQRGGHLFDWRSPQNVQMIAINPCHFLEDAARSALKNNSDFNQSLDEFLASIQPVQTCLLMHLIGQEGEEFIRDAARRYLKKRSKEDA